MKTIVLSDVTITYQNCEGLKRTLNSLLNQELKNDRVEIKLEVIVIDGASTDGTVELLKSYKDKFNKTGFSFYYISEPDSGIYYAMNKGITLANGEWIFFLNSGDALFSNDSLVTFYSYVEENDLFGRNILYGDSNREYNPNNSVDTVMRPLPLSSILYGLPFSHQSVFTMTGLFKNRHYDESYKISGDYEWFLNAYQEGRTFEYIPVCIGSFDTNGISQTHRYENYLEADRIRTSHGIVTGRIARFFKKVFWWVVDRLGISSRSIERLNCFLRK